MGMWSRLAKAFRLVQTRPTVDDYIDVTHRTQDLARTKYQVPADQQEMILRASGYVHICTWLRATFFASVAIRAYTSRNPGNVETRRITSRKRLKWLRGPRVGKAAQHADDAANIREIVDHPMIDMLQRPNGQDTGVEFRRLHSAYEDLTGNAYWLGLRYLDMPVEVRHLQPQHVSVLASDNTAMVTGYGYGRDRAKVRVFQPDDVMHFKYAPSLTSPYLGSGPLHGIVTEADVIAAATQWELNFWNNSARPDFSVSVAPGTPPGVIDQIKAMFKRRHRGVSKAGEPFIGEGLEIKPIGWQQREMQYVEGRNQLKDTICDAFGMCGMLDDHDGSITIGGGGLSTSETMFYRQTILPKVTAFCEALTEKYIEWFGLEPGEYWFAPDNPVPDDDKSFADIAVAKCNAGLMLIDEAREEMGLEPLPDGLGQIPRFNGNPMTAESQSAAPFGGGGGLPWLHLNPGGSPKPELPAAEDKPAPAPEPAGKSAKCCAGHGDLSHAKVWHGDWDHSGTKSAETGFVSRDVFRQLVTDVQTWIQSISPTLDGNEVTFDIGAVERAFVESASGAIDDGFMLGFDRAAGSVNVDATQNEVRTAAQRYLSSYKLELARQVTQSVKDRMTDILRTFTDQSASRNEIAIALQDAAGGEAYWMADRIARTELANAYQYGNMAAWKESTAVVGKRFELAAGACSVCQEVARLLGDKVYPIDAPFFTKGQSISVGGRTVRFDFRDIDTGTIHPNDRCRVVPVFAHEVGE